MFGDLKLLFTKFSMRVKVTLFILFTLFAIYTSSNLYDTKTAEFEEDFYEQINTSILDTTKLLIHQKENASLLASLSMASNPVLVDVIFGKRYTNLPLNQISLSLGRYTDFSDVWFSVIDADTNIMKRSWTSTNGDNLKFKPYMEDILRYKKPKTFLNIDEFGFGINSLVPILYDGDFAGILSVITHFDSIVSEIAKYGFKAVVVLNEKESKLIDITKSFSKKFLGNNYVANKNADDTAMKIINHRGFEYYTDFNGNYRIHQRTNTFETTYTLKDNQGKDVGYIILLRPLDELNMDELTSEQDIHVLLTIFIIIVIGLIIYYRNSAKFIAQVKLDNEQLLVKNSEINDKNDELDFNEKKIANMFYIQPNFVVLSDGQSIENVNERMMWLILGNDDGGLAEIQKRHKDISELFQPFEDEDVEKDDYFCSNKIEGMPWKDYILENFKRNYKVCIKDVFGNIHHFSIKMNEMKYLKDVKRYIVITFIDITNEIKLQKKMQEQQLAMSEQSKMAQMGEMIAHISHQWRQPLSAISLAASGMKFKNEMGLLKNEDINGLAENIVDNSKFLSETINDFTNFIKEKAETKQVDLMETIKLALKIVDTTYKSHNIDIVKTFSEDKLIRTMIPGELSQVIMNVMANAKDELIKQEKENKWIKIIIKKENSDAVITIEDNAGGIPEHVLPNIFKQYFTTKDESTGTGLGLYMSKGLIENNLGGKLNVVNTDNGALFTIIVPLDKVIEHA